MSASRTLDALLSRTGRSWRTRHDENRTGGPHGRQAQPEPNAQGAGNRRIECPLSFLMRLRQVQLPVRVANPDEIRLVSVLLATGLIEADIAALKSTAPYASSRIATVTRITKDGQAEIANMGDVPAFATTSMQFTRGFRLM